mgnify:CR=1 FL=1
MKKILLFVFVVFASLTLFTGCKKSGTTTSGSYTMTVTVGGVAHTYSNVYAVLSGPYLTITGNSGSTPGTTAYPAFSTVIYTYSAPGTYNVTSGSAGPGVAGTYAPDATMTNWDVAMSGSATITAITATEVTGSVNFTNVSGTTSVGTFTAKKMW